MRFIPLRRTSALLAAALSVLLVPLACGKPGGDATSDASTPPPPGSDAGNTPSDAGMPPSGNDGGTQQQATGYDALKASDVATACTRYKAELAAKPNDAQAAFGAFASCVVQLPDHAAVVDVLDSCKQKHIDFGHTLFGATGAFAKHREELKGTGTLALELHAGSNTPFAAMGFTVDAAIARTETSTSFINGVSQTTKQLALHALDRDFKGDGRAAEVNIQVPYDDSQFTSNGTKVPLADGMTIDATKLRGGVSVNLPGGPGNQDTNIGSAQSGQVKFNKVGQAVGSAIDVEFVNVVVQGYRANCGSAGTPCQDSDKIFIRINGKVTDTVTDNIEIPLPFNDVKSDDGPPVRSKEIVALDQCASTFSVPYLQGQLKKLTPEIDTLAGYLDAAVANSDDNFQFLLPKGLVFGDDDIPLNVTDLRALRAALDVAQAGARLAVQYDLLSKTYQQLAGTYLEWTYNSSGQPAQRSRRDILIRTFVDDLNATFLTKEAGFDVSAVQSHLVHALDLAYAALSKTPGRQGFLNFQASGAKNFSADLATFDTFLKTSLSSAGLQPFPHASAYQLGLKAYFDAPLQRSDLLTASTSGKGIFDVTAGQPNATNIDDRNDHFKLDGDGVRTAVKPFFTLPADLSSQSCGRGAPCPTGYTCSVSPTDMGGNCQNPELILIDDAARKEAMPDNRDPFFIDAATARLVKMLFNG